MMTSPDDQQPSRFNLSRLNRFYVYAAFAACWIAASAGLLATRIGDQRLEMGKGLIFLAVSSVLLYLLFDVWRKSAAVAHSAYARQAHFVLLLAALVMPLLGFALVKVHLPQAERDAYENLEAVARLKGDQVENWLAERRGDGLVLAADRDFAAHVERLVRQPRDASLLKPVQARFDVLRIANGYDSIVLLDANGQLLISSGERGDPHQAQQSLLRHALDSRQVQRGEIYRDGQGSVHLDWAIPVTAADAQGERAVAVVVLRTALERFLFPQIQTWPAASVSGETLLVREEGGDALYLNQLRHRTEAPLSLRLPMTNSGTNAGLPEVAALRASGSGTMQGEDYRGVRVVAAYRPVSGTSWRVVAKSDRDELLVPLRSMVFWIGLTALSTIFVIVVGQYVFRRCVEHKQ
ncbi:MAG TPA: cache domain-containing protein [Gallionella sp.]|nr:cache domain-containing protein [Gallionella sp.]